MVYTTASKEVVADFIYEEIVMNFGLMSEIVTNRGAHFTSGLVQAYLKRVGTSHFLTSAYHPRSNSKVERFNSVIKQMLHKYTNGAINRWDEYVNSALWASRIRIHSTTRFSPYYLTYDREPRFPGDVLTPYMDTSVFKNPSKVAQYASRETAQLASDRALAAARMTTVSEQDKARWDANIKPFSFQPGDMVKLTHEGKLGLEPRFKGPYIVVDAFPDYGTYKLKTVAGQPLQSLVHVDRLAPAFGAIPTSPWGNV